MATFTASAAQANAPVIYAVNRVVTRVVEYTQSASYSAGDVIQMCRIPNGAVVTDVRISGSFSAGVVTVNIGDGNDVSAYGASVVLSGAGVQVANTFTPYRGLGRSYSAEDTVDLQVAAISTPPANAVIRMAISYTNQNNGQ
jgi:hypothetical protein